MVSTRSRGGESSVDTEIPSGHDDQLLSPFNSPIKGLSDRSILSRSVFIYHRRNICVTPCQNLFTTPFNKDSSTLVTETSE